MEIDYARIMRIMKGGICLKYRVLVTNLNELGWYKIRQGGNHEIFTNGKDYMPVPRHKEINEMLAKSIIKKAKES